MLFDLERKTEHVDKNMGSYWEKELGDMFNDPRKPQDGNLSNVSSVLVPSNEPLVPQNNKMKMKKKNTKSMSFKDV